MRNLLYLIIALSYLFSFGCQQKTIDAPQVSQSVFGTMPDGVVINLYTLSNSNDVEVGIINYGGIIQSIRIPDTAGNKQDVALGFDNLQDYIDKSPYFGCITGRYANRIAKGKFMLDSIEYQLDLNNGPNSLHGGFKGFDKQVWKAEDFSSDSVAGVILTYLSPDGDQGYPGNLDVSVTYTLNNQNELRIDYNARTDKKTVVNLTNHSYFNLDNGGQSDILDHQLKIIADSFTPTDETLIPSGEIIPVEATPMDFTSFKTIGENLDTSYRPIAIAGGYDHNYVLSSGGGELALAAVVKEPGSGRKMEVFTTEPGIQFYSGNFLDGSITGKNGAVYHKNHGFCLETQHFPDSPNQPEFPSTVLNPGENYSSTTIYRFFQ
jgi:aldose 1-epimerase